MEENKSNRDGQDTPKRTKARPIKRSASSNGQKSPSCSNTATEIWDNCTTIRSARGDENMDVDVQKSPEMGSETRKRKLTVLANPVLEKKPKQDCYFSSSTKIRDEISSYVEVQGQEIACSHTFLVLGATTGTSKPNKSDIGCQTAKTPLVPVSPVVSFSEPMRKIPTYIENGYFGPGAVLADGTLRRPPDIIVPETSAVEDSPKTEEKTEDKGKVKEKTEDEGKVMEKKEPTPQPKKDVAQDEDPKKKKNVNNTDRYLNMF